MITTKILHFFPSFCFYWAWKNMRSFVPSRKWTKTNFDPKQVFYFCNLSLSTYFSKEKYTETRSLWEWNPFELQLYKLPCNIKCIRGCISILIRAPCTIWTNFNMPTQKFIEKLILSAKILSHLFEAALRLQRRWSNSLNLFLISNGKMKIEYTCHNKWNVNRIHLSF